MLVGESKGRTHQVWKLGRVLETCHALAHPVKVGPETDVLLAAPRSDILDMIGNTVMCRVLRVDEGRIEDDHAEKQPDSGQYPCSRRCSTFGRCIRDSHNAVVLVLSRSDEVEHVVRDVPRMVADGPRAGMRKDHGRSRQRDCL